MDETKQKSDKFLKKKIVILIIAILAIILVMVLIYFFNQDEFCSKIENKLLKQRCLSCKDAQDQIDCRDNIYISLAGLKNNLTFCENIVRDYNKELCSVSVQIANKRSLFIHN